MRKFLVFLLAFTVMGVFAASCTGGDDDATSDDDVATSPTGSPTTNPNPGPYDLTVNGDGTAWPHADGTIVFVRVLDTDSSNRVVICRNNVMLASNTFTLSTTNSLTASHNFKAEAIADVGSSAGMIDGTDHKYEKAFGPATDNVTVSVPHTGSFTGTWTGTPCP